LTPADRPHPDPRTERSFLAALAAAAGITGYPPDPDETPDAHDDAAEQDTTLAGHLLEPETPGAHEGAGEQDTAPAPDEAPGAREGAGERRSGIAGYSFESRRPGASEGAVRLGAAGYSFDSGEPRDPMKGEKGTAPAPDEAPGAQEGSGEQGTRTAG